jgi:hypothetical protein
VADAVRLVEGVYDHLDRDSLAGTLRTTAVLDTCWRVLAAAGDPRADGLLARAQTLLREASDTVGDPAMAAQFLRVPANARLLRAEPAAR